MGFDLTGLSGMLGSVPQGYDEAQRRHLINAQAQNELRQAQMQQAAQAAAMRGMSGGPPPPQSMPMPGAMPMPQGSTPAAQGAPQPGAGMGPGGAMGGGGPQPGGAPQGPPGGQGGMPGMSVQQLAQVIKARNPGIDDATLFQAVAQANQLLNPESRMLLQYMMAQQKNDTTVAGQDKRLEGTRETITGRSEVAGAQIGSREKIAGTAEEGRNSRAASAETGRNSRAAAKVAGKPDETEYKTLTASLRQQTSQITDAIRENGGMVPEAGSPKRAKYDAIVSKKNATLDRMIEVRKRAEKGGSKLPSPSEAVNTPEQKAVPDGLPDAKGLAEGTTAKDKAGNVAAVVKGGAWVAP